MGPVRRNRPSQRSALARDVRRANTGKVHAQTRAAQAEHSDGDKRDACPIGRDKTLTRMARMSANSSAGRMCHPGRVCKELTSLFGAFWRRVFGARGATGCFIRACTEGSPTTKKPRYLAQLRQTAPDRTRPHQTAPKI
jgi:hypothetical protein